VIPLPMPTIALLVALGVSLLGNAVLTKLYLGVRDDRAKVTGERDQARSAATACSDGVKALQAAAAEREREGRKAGEKARVEAEAHQSAAQRILSTPAAVPGNDCASARVRLDGWLKARKP
jgi:hypothetical protein